MAKLNTSETAIYQPQSQPKGRRSQAEQKNHHRRADEKDRADPWIDARKKPLTQEIMSCEIHSEHRREIEPCFKLER